MKLTQPPPFEIQVGKLKWHIELKRVEPGGYAYIAARLEGDDSSHWMLSAIANTMRPVDPLSMELQARVGITKALLAEMVKQGLAD